MTDGIAPDEFNLRVLPASFYADPYPTYARLRREAPVLRCPDGSVFLTRHADLLTVYRDNRRFSSDKKTQFAPVFGSGSPLYDHHTTSLVFNDPPLHTRVRRAIGDALAARVVGALQAAVETLVSRLLAQLHSGQRVDLIDAYASAIPVEVISNLLAVPAAERSPLREWSLRILGALEVGAPTDVLAAGHDAVQQFLVYLTELIDRRLPGLTPDDDDILARLLRAEGEAGVLSRHELLHQCIFLLNAGHETTTNLIGNGIGLLADHDDIRRQVLTTPALIEPLVEEVLRLESPNQLGNRTAVVDGELGGVPIPAGTIITLCIGAANRDPDVFAEPDMLRLDRPAQTHLAFGSGIHTCAGLAVARLEGRIGLLRMLERFPAFRIVRSERAPRARFRGYSRLEVELA